MYFRINTPAVTHQLINGEVIALNLENGHYYSLCGTAAWLWERIQLGSMDAVVRAAEQELSGDAAQIGNEVEAFLRELLTEQLLVEAPSRQLADMPVTELTQTVYSTPVLEKYTEMSDLLLLDPIHDVDESGWPRVAEPQTISR